MCTHAIMRINRCKCMIYCVRFYVQGSQLPLKKSYLCIGDHGSQGEEGEKGPQGDQGRPGLAGRVLYKQVPQGKQQ